MVEFFGLFNTVSEIDPTFEGCALVNMVLGIVFEVIGHTLSFYTPVEGRGVRRQSDGHVRETEHSAATLGPELVIEPRYRIVADSVTGHLERSRDDLLAHRSSRHRRQRNPPRG